MENSGGQYDSDGSNQYSYDDIDFRFSLKIAVVDELDWKKNQKMGKLNDEDEDEEDEDEDITEALMAQMGYGKTKTQTAKLPEEEEEEEDGDITEDLLKKMGNGKTGPPKHEPPATPIPAENLKSAMKASSVKKQELSDEGRKVTWAEDVYDPIPSAECHLATNRIERHRKDDKMSGKNRQKWGGKGAGRVVAKKEKEKGKDKDRGGKDEKKQRGGGVGGGGGGKGGKGKDKKQVKKFGGGSSTKKCFDTLEFG